MVEGRGKGRFLIMKVPMDVRERIKNLEERGLLVRVKRPTNKDTEIHPIVRWQFRGGIREEDRKAFLFENVVDGRRKYKGSVLVGGLAASRSVYGLGMAASPQRSFRNGSMLWLIRSNP
jgi:3-polyprenyl-4-hydroxybenzoate decarboxylase